MSVEFDAEIWAQVVRHEALIGQLESGINLTQELAAMFNSTSEVMNANSQKLSSNLRKMKKLDKLISDHFLITSYRACALTKDALEKDSDAVDKHAKNIDTGIAVELSKIAEGKVKAKAELEAELEKKKKPIDNLKVHLSKKTKETQKLWTELQSHIKALGQYRDQMAKEPPESSKKEKFKKSIEKEETYLINNKTAVRTAFREIEALVQHLNSLIKEFNFVYMKEHIKKMVENDSNRILETKAALEKYLKLQRDYIAALTANADKLENVLTSVDPEADSIAFMKTNVSAQALNAASQEIAPDLPCDSKSVDQVVDGALRAAAGIIMSSSGSQNAMKISGFSSANNSKSNTQEDFADDIPADHRTYTADYDFDNEGDDTYMNLSVGDILIITDTSDNDWWGGYKSSDPKKQIRWIPSSYISPSQ
jgi:myosin heavy subunit